MQRVRFSKKLLFFFCVLSILGCTQKNPPTVKQLQEVSNQNDRIKLDLLFWGDLKGQVETCSCSLQPLGGLHRLKKYLSAEKKLNPDTLFLSTGGLFNDSSNEKESNEIIAFESSYPSSGAVLRKSDLDHIKNKKLNYESKSFLLMGQEKKIRYKDKLNISIRPLDNSESYSKFYNSLSASTLNIYLSTLPLEELDKLPPSKESILEIFLGSSSSEADEFKCFARHKRLFCLGGQKGRSIGHLKLNLLNTQANWLDYGVLTFNAESFDFFTQQKENTPNKVEALKALSEAFRNEWRESNFFTLKSIYMNKDFDN